MAHKIIIIAITSPIITKLQFLIFFVSSTASSSLVFCPPSIFRGLKSSFLFPLIIASTSLL